MKKKQVVIIGIAVLVFIGVIFWLVAGRKPKKEKTGPVPTISKSIAKLSQDELTVDFEAVSDSKGQSIILTISGWPKGVESFEYEMTYEAYDKSGKLVPQGVIGSLVFISELDGEYSKKIFLGSCSRNVCVAHKGMESVKVLIRLSYEDGEVKIWEKEFEMEGL